MLRIKLWGDISPLPFWENSSPLSSPGPITGIDGLPTRKFHLKKKQNKSSTKRYINIFK